MTGRHTVRDIFCTSCQTVLGWKYVRKRMSLRGLLSAVLTADHLKEKAFEDSQKYKEGKYILEVSQANMELDA
jgi:hypothetical protein